MHHEEKKNLPEVAFLSVEEGDTVANREKLYKKNGD